MFDAVQRKTIQCLDYVVSQAKAEYVFLVFLVEYCNRGGKKKKKKKKKKRNINKEQTT